MSSNIDNSAINLHYFPQEIWKEIFSYLPINDLTKITAVCKKWNEWSNQDLLWNRHAMELNIEMIKIPNSIKEKGVKACVAYYFNASSTTINKTITLFSTKIGTIHEFETANEEDLKKLITTFTKNYFTKKDPKACLLQIEISFEDHPDSLAKLSITDQSFLSVKIIDRQIIKKIKCCGELANLLSATNGFSSQSSNKQYNGKAFTISARFEKVADEIISAAFSNACDLE